MSTWVNDTGTGTTNQDGKEQQPAMLPIVSARTSPSLTPMVKAGRSLPPAKSAYLAGLGLVTLPRAAGRDLQTLELIRIVRDLDADAAAAIWYFLRIANSGHTVEVLDEGNKPNLDATAQINELAQTVYELGGGGADTLMGTLFMSFLSYGGAGIDVEITDDLLDVVDFHPFGPADIEFRGVKDEATGKVKIKMFPARTLPGVDKVPVNPVQTHYVPVDPDLDDPYGRPPFLPALDSLLKLTNTIKVLQDVAKVHGFGMRDVKLLEIAVRDRAPENLKAPGNEDALAAYMDSILAQVKSALEELEPTDTFAHWDNMEIGTTVPGGQGINLDSVIAILGRRAKTALKTMPILLGETESTTQTRGTVQWQVYVKGIKTVQQLCKRLMEAAYNTALRVWGIPGRTCIEFETVRETDELIEANVETAIINNAERKYKLGVIDHAQMSDEIAGHSPKGPRPPTYADEFRAANRVDETRDAPTGEEQPAEDAQDVEQPPSNQPGSDAGLTEEEGAVLDAVSA
jgi:hypothetical protein